MAKRSYSKVIDLTSFDKTTKLWQLPAGVSFEMRGKTGTQAARTHRQAIRVSASLIHIDDAFLSEYRWRKAAFTKPVS